MTKAASANEPASLMGPRLVAEAVKPNASLTELARLAELDPGFALRLLAAVNSAAYGLSTRVSDVKHAATVLGLRGLRNLALGLVVSDMAPAGEDGELLLANSLRRAAAGRLIAERLGERQADEYFTVGLLLEVGLIARARDSLPAVSAAAQLPAMQRILIERAGGAIDHATRGGQIVREFGLPAEIAEAVERHHVDAPPSTRLALVAWAAERVAAVWESGNPTDAQVDAVTALRAAGLGEAEAKDVLERIPALVMESAAAFQRAVPRQQNVAALLVDANRTLLQMNRNYEGLVRQLESLLQEREALTTQLETANQQLATLAATDGLTGLLNKRSLKEALARDLARADRGATSLGLVILDVDFFKKVNDTHGHLIGDQVLECVSRVLTASLRAGDVAARYGGEEFVALLPGSDAAGAAVVAERIRTRLEQTAIPIPNGSLRVTASFGVVAVRGPGCRTTGEDLIASADAALYVAKRGGRNRVVLAPPERAAPHAESH